MRAAASILALGLLVACHSASGNGGDGGMDLAIAGLGSGDLAGGGGGGDLAGGGGGDLAGNSGRSCVAGNCATCTTGVCCGAGCCNVGEWCDNGTCRCGDAPASACGQGMTCASNVAMANGCGFLCCGHGGAPCPP